jgi:uncharacterized DUF497 family protein
MYTEIRAFEWDGRKARRNIGKHGIRFQEATSAFTDPFGIIEEDVAHSQRERRLRLLGEAGDGRLLLIIFTMRPGPTLRLISARSANRIERKMYALKRYFSIS